MADEVVIQPIVKKWYMSRTFYVQLLMLIVMIMPAAQPFVNEYFSEIGMGWALVNIVLRLLTKGKVEL
jgi:hypothetical protein